MANHEAPMTSAEAVNWAMGEILKTPAKTPRRIDQRYAGDDPSAEYAKHNPLGGPASVFRAMASRIEAGEEYYSVLEDYGFQVADHATPDKNRHRFEGGMGMPPDSEQERNAIIEECALACEALRPDWPSLDSDIYEVVEDCATAIRALKESAAPPATPVPPSREDYALRDELKNAAPQAPSHHDDMSAISEGGSMNRAEPAVAAPKLSEARRLEDAIVAAKLDAFEAADMLGAIIASLLARYGDEHEAFYDIKNYSTKMEAAIMDLDK